MMKISTLIFVFIVCGSVAYHAYLQNSTARPADTFYPQSPSYAPICLIGGFDHSLSDDVEVSEKDHVRAIVHVANRGGGYYYTVFFTSDEPVVFSIHVPLFQPPRGNGNSISKIKLAEYQKIYAQQVMESAKGFLVEVSEFSRTMPKYSTTDLTQGFEAIQRIVEQPRYIPNIATTTFLDTDGCEDLVGKPGRDECACPKKQIESTLYCIGWKNESCLPGKVRASFNTRNDFLDFLTLSK